MNFLFWNDTIVCDLVYIFAKRTLYRNLATNRHLTRNAVIKKITGEKSLENKSFLIFITNYFSQRITSLYLALFLHKHINNEMQAGDSF